MGEFVYFLLDWYVDCVMLVIVYYFVFVVVIFI